MCHCVNRVFGLECLKRGLLATNDCAKTLIPDKLVKLKPANFECCIVDDNLLALINFLHHALLQNI